MLTAAVLLGAAVALGLLAALTAVRGLRGRRRLVRAVAAVLALAVVSATVVYGWAAIAVDRSTLARTVLWGSADTGDIERFEERPIRAGAQALRLPRCQGGDPDLSGDRVDGRRSSLAAVLEGSDTEAFLVLRDRCVAYRWSASPGDLARRHTSFSVAKSFLSALVGIALARGDLGDLDDPITTYLPELVVRDRRFERVTLRHLVSMRSGLRYEEAGLPWSDDAVTYYSPDLRETALSAEVAEPPGERWHYNNYNPLLVGMALERATGMPVSDYMQRHLWKPMGASSAASWSVDSPASGLEKLESGVNATPLDFARFGYLFAHEGEVLGEQVVPADWVRTSTRPRSETPLPEDFGYWWWQDRARPGRFLARGNLGQFVYVDPRSDVVVVRLGQDFGTPDWVPLLRHVADAVGSP